ncbi:MAG: type II toxin-antitoxin system RelE/ParE family toxin [Lachnospiraceae bacterium]|nr:type II toxin-antitoxin system RelE/ParE family toxin [Lachnospiraceae bacterium]
MTYKIEINKKALKFILKQPKNKQIALFSAINKLPEGNTKKLSGHDLYRLRVGDYRIIYTIDNGKLVICVIDAGNRGQIYNKY